MDGNEEEAAAEEDEEAIDPLNGFRGGWTTKQPYSGKRKKERKRDQKGKGERKDSFKVKEKEGTCEIDSVIVAQAKHEDESSIGPRRSFFFCLKRWQFTESKEEGVERRIRKEVPTVVFFFFFLLLFFLFFLPFGVSSFMSSVS